MIDLLLLGNGAMTPLPDRWLSSLLVRCRGELALFDCGEGTQIPWKQFGWGFRRLGAICLSHTHADHVAGLPGLLHALANADRKHPVHVYGPVGTAHVVGGLRTIAPDLPYELLVHELVDGDRFPLPGRMSGRVTLGEHRAPCLAYRVDLPRARRFDAERATELQIPRSLWRQLQDGNPVSWPGRVADPGDVLGPPRRGLSIAYVTDTRPLPSLVSFLRGVDHLVCEGTYGDSADLAKAVRHKHMTFAESATLARDAGVGALWLTHFSPALADPNALLGEATDIFPNTTAGYSGLVKTISYRDD